MLNLQSRHSWFYAGLAAGLLGYQFLRRSREEDLRGQTCLITGGSRGLGLQLAREFAAEGCRLILCARDEEELARAQEDLETRGADVLTVPCDVADRAQIQRVVFEAKARFGPIDILVNNAGIIRVGPVENMTLEDFDDAMKIMFWGGLYPIWEVLPDMLERGRGHIVNITSIGGKISIPHLLPYSCAKFAMVALSEGLNAELAGAGIHVLTVVPGLMRTGSFVNAEFKGHREEELSWFAAGDTTPLTAMNAQRAARQIVRSTKRRDREQILTWQASLAARLHGIAPELTLPLMDWVNRGILPEPAPGETAPESGREVKERLQGAWRRTVDTLARVTGESYHQPV